MKYVQSAFVSIFVLIAVFGASSCALYEELEPLGPDPDEADARSDVAFDVENDARDADFDTISDADADNENISDVHDPNDVGPELDADADSDADATSGDALQWMQLSVGQHYSCAVTADGDAYCWGRNNVDGRLGNGSVDSSSNNANLNGDANALVPTAVHGGISFASVSTGAHHTCGLTPAGKAYCWGAGVAGQLGQGANVSSAVPVAVNGAYQFSEIRLGTSHTCALELSKILYCWGYNTEGQVGQSSGSSYNIPRRVLGQEFVAVALGSSHSCAISESGPTYCWGRSNEGQLGDGWVLGGAELVQVDTDEEFVALSAGRNYTCGLTATGEVFCWGENDYGALGDGTTIDRRDPVRAVPGQTFVSIYTGAHSTCALDNNQDIYCWGFNGQGNFGIGRSSADGELLPVLVSGGYQWRDFSHGLQHACGLVDGMDELFCWGDNDYGQLGLGTTSDFIAYPAAVANPSLD